MIELKHRRGTGQIAYIFKKVPELDRNVGETNGFIEQWYSGGDRWKGVKATEEKLVYAELVSRGQGLCLGRIGFYGIAAQDKFYDEESFLVNGAILTASKRRENFGRKESNLLKIKVSAQIPEKIISILAETKEKVLETAEILKLPLESAVLTE